MRNSTGWNDFDFAAFRRLSAEVNDAVALSAGTVESKMQWIAERVNSVKSTPSGRGYDWNSFPRDEWNRALQAARGALTSMLGELSSSQHQIDDGHWPH
jgi:hypothetical protein